MLKLLNCIFAFLGINNINIENFNNINNLFNDYDIIKTNKKKKNKYIICYNIFILIILLIKPIYFLYEIIIHNNKNFYSTLFYLINNFINYIILLIYFKADYFEKILFDYYAIRKKYKKFNLILNNICIPLIIIICSILTYIIDITTNIFLNNTDYNNTDYNNNTELNYINIYNFNNNETFEIILSINIIFGLCDIYSYILILLNTFIFFLVFMKHLFDLKILVKKLINKYSWSKDTQHTEVSALCYEITWLRSELENSIEKLEPLFVSNTLLGSIALGFIIEFGNITIYQIISLIYWFISQVIYLIIIYYINNNKSDLIKVIKKPKFVIHYIRRKFNKSKFNDVVNNLNFGRQKTFIETQNSLYNKQDIELNNIKIEDSKIMEDINKNDINILLNNIDENKITDTIIDKITTEEYNIKNASSIDWIILNTILNESWGCFSFFGFEFSDTNNLKSTIGLTGILIFVSKWFIELNIV